jgi:hypothetical protein
MPVSRDEVIHGFRLIMGREPDSEDSIQHHMKLRDADELVSVLLKSAEFRKSPRFKEFLHVRPTALSEKADQRPHARRAAFRALVIGNCQVAAVATLMQAMTGDVLAEALEATPTVMERLQSGEEDLGPKLARADFVFVQMNEEVVTLVQERHPESAHKLRSFPPINYAAFHPDCVYIKAPDGRHLPGPMGDYHSSIAFWAWTNGWSVAEALALYNEETYELLEFGAQEEVARKVLQGFGRIAHLPLEPLMHEWDKSGVWMHTVNHPKIATLASMTAELLRREGLEPITEAAHVVDDTLARYPIWPVYPPIARRLGVEGSYLFKVDRGICPPSQPHLFLTLEDFVRASFACYDQFDRDALRCDRLRSAGYRRLGEQRKPSRLRQAAAAPAGWFARFFGAPAAAVEEASEAPPVEAGSPYAGLADHQFWRRAMEKVPAAEVDPVVGSPRFRIASTDRVATAGSCFAQHIARTLKHNGLQYFVAETGEHLAEAEREQRQFGLFSARFGNIYTARQLVQLFERAYGRFHPLDRAWKRPDGRFVDPFRPQVEPDGYATEQEVQAAAEEHLAKVREMFEKMDVFVFTLGLTEAWQRREDGAVFPLAPGVVAGAFDPERYGFLNFGVKEVMEDIRTAVVRIRSINSRVRFVFTVSPVPLIATYEERHVLVSTTESKAVLRAAIGEVAAADSGVAYFPSYEVITGPHARGRYFASDLRNVTDEGVAHVMRLFMQHYTGTSLAAPAPSNSADALDAYEAEQREMANVVCDEEAIERHRAG